MKFKTNSDYPVIAEINDDTVVLSCTYNAHRADNKTNEFKKVEISENITLTFDELVQIYNAFKKFMGEM